MITEFFTIDKENPDMALLEKGASAIRRGGLVAFPTETVYGLGANGLDERAVKSIYQAKGRPSDNPLILHIANLCEVAKLAEEIPANARALMEKFWPGPLTVILKRTRVVPDVVTGGLDTVAIRMPSAVIARQLVHLSGVPIAAPSANISGRPSPTQAGDVLHDMNGKIDVVIDGGPCDVGVESTIVDCTTPVPTILRPGGVTREQLMEVLGEVELDQALLGANTIPRAPGMKYTHYAPVSPMTLFEGGYEFIREELPRRAADALAKGQKTGALVSEETLPHLPAKVVAISYGSREKPEDIAANLYTALRYFDDKAVNLILGEGISEEGIGLAVMNRMRKAAGFRIVKDKTLSSEK